MKVKPISPICKRQIRQLHHAKRFPVIERHNHAVLTYAYIRQAKYQLDIYKQQVEKKPIKTFKRYDNRTLRYIHKKYLINWNMALRACLLNGLFFRNYGQAYNSLTRMVKLGLLTKQGKNFFVVK